MYCAARRNADASRNEGELARDLKVVHRVQVPVLVAVAAAMEAGGRGGVTVQAAV